jgi:hypothetical protein
MENNDDYPKEIDLIDTITMNMPWYAQKWCFLELCIPKLALIAIAAYIAYELYGVRVIKSIKPKGEFRKPKIGKEPTKDLTDQL